MVTRISASQAASGAAKAVQKNVKAMVAGTLGLSGERMSKVDTAWLRMDCPSNLMMIVGVWILRPGIRIQALRERVEGSLLRYRRFQQRVVEDAGGATWVDDSRFAIEDQVVLEKLQRKARQSDQDALQARVGELSMRPLDRKHPLWQFHLIENYVGPDGLAGSAMIVRIHHCIADGIALISVMNSLVDGGAPPPERRSKKAGQGPDDWITDTLLKPFTQLTVKALGAAGAGAAKTLHLLSDPKTGMAGTFDMAKVGYQLVSDLAAMALMPDDSKTRLKGKPGTTKRVAWCQPIPLEEVKAVGKALNASINDVLLSCVAGAIGEYLRSKGDNPTGQEIRAMVPVNLRPMEEAY
ncbi:MAG: hypothetical protein RLZZ401_393, partial [Pseudomonadota bacterium]